MCPWGPGKPGASGQVEAAAHSKRSGPASNVSAKNGIGGSSARDGGRAPRESIYPSVHLWTGNDIGIDLGGRELFSAVNFHVFPGTRLRVAGPSGTGKSTFLRMLLGYVQPSKGSLLWNKQLLTPAVAKDIRLKTAYMPQSNPLAAGENADVHFQRISTYHANRDLRETYLDRVNAMLDRLGLDPTVRRQPVSELSGGERNRIVLAGLLALNRPVLMLDEPTTGLDADNRRRVSSVIRQLPDSTSVLLVSHDSEWDFHNLFQEQLVLA